MSTNNKNHSTLILIKNRAIRWPMGEDTIVLTSNIVYEFDALNHKPFELKLVGRDLSKHKIQVHVRKEELASGKITKVMLSSESLYRPETLNVSVIINTLLQTKDEMLADVTSAKIKLKQMEILFGKLDEGKEENKQSIDDLKKEIFELSKLL